MVVCKNCGAFMRFDPADQLIKCDHCDSALSPKAVEDGKGSGAVVYEDFSPVGEGGATMEVTVYTCPQCGGDIMCDDDTMATFCSYCGASSIVLSKRMERVQKPSFIIPFKKSRQDCERIYRSFVDRAVFAPSYMKDSATIEKFRGIYMPYWVYNVRHNGPLTVKGTTSSRKGDYVYTSTYDVSTEVKADFRGIAFDASASFSDNISRGIAPYNIREAEVYRESYISGFYADMCDVAGYVYEDEALDIAEKELVKKITEKLKGYSLNMKTASGEGAKVGQDTELDYFPVWFLGIRDEKTSLVSYAVVNGQTGKVAMDMPIDYGKYILGSVLLSLPIMGVLNLMVQLKPPVILMAGVLFALFSLALLNTQMDSIYTRYLGSDDRGRVYKSANGGADEEPVTGKGRRERKLSEFADRGKTGGGLSFLGTLLLIIVCGNQIILPLLLIEEIRNLALAAVGIYLVFKVMKALGKGNNNGNAVVMPLSQKAGVLIRPVAAVLISVIVFLVNPVRDIFYYGGAIISMLLVLTCFYDLIKGHNRLAKRMPPQMNRRAE